MNKLTVEDLDLKGKRVLVRVDFNVPLEGGRVADDKRIRAALPTIKYITNAGGKLILMSHLGRPKGKRVPEISLEPCTTVLEALLGRKVKFIEDCIGEEVQTAVENLGESDILLLENLRYYIEETENDPDFAAEYSYETAQILFEALSRSDAVAKLKGAIINHTFSGLQEDIAIDQYGDTRRKRSLITVKNGQFITME